MGSDDDGWSALYFFRAMRDSQSMDFAVIGDMGNINAKSAAELQKTSQAGIFDAVIHVGKWWVG